jgi:hypothetical protein
MKESILLISAVVLSDWAPGTKRIGARAMFPFRRSAKQSELDDRHLASGESERDFVPEIAAQAETLQLSDADPVYSFTATAQLRRQDPRYVQLWPSDIPHKRR